MTRLVGRIPFAIVRSKRQSDRNLSWITYTETMQFLPQAQWIIEAAGKSPNDRPLAQMRVNDLEIAYAAVKAGLGRSYLPHYLADTDPDLLADPSPGDPRSRELWIMIHPGIKNLARMRLTADWLISVVASELGGKRQA